MVLMKMENKIDWTYALDFYYRNRRYRIRLNTRNKRLAVQLMHKVQDEIFRDVFRIEKYEKKDVLIRDYFKDYTERIQGTKKESTLRGERIYINTLVGIIGNMFLRNIDRRTVEMWRMTRLSKVRPASFNIELRFMKMLFRRAKEEGLVEENPFHFMKQIRVEEKRLYLNPAEIKSFFVKIRDMIKCARNVVYRESHYKFMLFCEVLISTGMRREEALTLQPSQIDYTRNVIIVEKSKGKKIREIPMTRRVREIMEELGPNMFRGLTRATVSHKFHAVATAVGLPNGMKLHSLRHTFATILITRGYDIKVVKELLGHEDIRVTEVYAKVSNDIMQRAVASIGNLYNHGDELVTKRELTSPDHHETP
jgi:site-specific recombinase XerD